MGETDVDKGYKLHAADSMLVRYGLSGNSNPMTTLYRDKSLLHLLLKGIERVAAHIFKGFL